MKKLIFLVSVLSLCLMLLVSCSSGSKGEEVLGDAQGLKYTLMDDGTYSVSGGDNAVNAPAEIVIPAEFNGRAVTAIEDMAFKRFWIESIIIPESVTYIGAGAFMDCTQLTTVILPQNLTVIRENTFRACTRLKVIDIPEGVRFIEKRAFRDCERMTSVYLPSSLESVGADAFYGCEGLRQVHISDPDTWCLVKFENEYSNPLYYGNYLYCDGEELREVWLEEGIEVIESYSFIKCKNLYSIVIPSSLKAVGESAFYGCENLNRRNYYGDKEGLGAVAIGKGNSLFTDVPVYVYSEERPTEYGRYWCERDGVAYVWGSVQYLMLPEADGYGVFEGIGIDVYIDDEYKYMPVKTVKAEAFRGNTELNSVHLGKNVQVIEKLAFRSCNNMRYIVIGAALTSVGEDAFLGCSLLDEVYYMGTAEQWQGISIENGNNNLKSALIYFYSETEPSEEGNWWHYVDGVPVVWANN